MSKYAESERVKMLNGKELSSGKYVLYWMQKSQRAEDNHALEAAVEAANRVDLPLLVVFGLTDAYPEENLRHYTFMIEGLRETGKSLHDRGIKFVVQKGSPAQVALRAGSHAAAIVCDRGYLRHQKVWRKQVAEEAFQTTVELNNRYFLDGRDPNSYAGVAWIYGVHDRAWAERPIFGKVRYMASSGLERKCDIKGYVKKVENFLLGAKPPK